MHHQEFRGDGVALPLQSPSKALDFSRRRPARTSTRPSRPIASPIIATGDGSRNPAIDSRQQFWF
jgi:hypothetical protein